MLGAFKSRNKRGNGLNNEERDRKPLPGPKKEILPNASWGKKLPKQMAKSRWSETEPHIIRSQNRKYAQAAKMGS